LGLLEVLILTKVDFTNFIQESKRVIILKSRHSEAMTLHRGSVEHDLWTILDDQGILSGFEKIVK